MIKWRAVNANSTQLLLNTIYTWIFFSYSLKASRTKQAQNYATLHQPGNLPSATKMKIWNLQQLIQDLKFTYDRFNKQFNLRVTYDGGVTGLIGQAEMSAEEIPVCCIISRITRRVHVAKLMLAWSERIKFLPKMKTLIELNEFFSQNIQINVCFEHSTPKRWRTQRSNIALKLI